MKNYFYTVIVSCQLQFDCSADRYFSGLDLNMGNLYRLSNAKTRSISPENFTGEKGKGGIATLEEGSAAKTSRDLRQGWKVNPYVRIKPGETFTMAEISGVVQFSISG